jgi:hypothetical protein
MSTRKFLAGMGVILHLKKNEFCFCSLCVVWVGVKVKSMTENACREGFYLILEKNINVRTLKGHQDRLIYVS